MTKILVHGKAFGKNFIHIEVKENGELLDYCKLKMEEQVCGKVNSLLEKYPNSKVLYR
jgi:hypothetical protein